MKELRFAFIKTTPVMFGYLFLGTAFGLLLKQAGYNFIWAFFISLFVYAGSMQFILLSFIGSPVALISVALTTLSVNSRHIFYGLSFMDFFKQMKRAYPYMIFSLTDETYSLLCSVKVPETLSKKRVFLAISMLDHSYWIIGSVFGAIMGQILKFNLNGIEFSMTALFIVIFVEQWVAAKSKIPALTGLVCGILALAIFGADNFLLIALISAIGILVVMQSRIVSKEPIAPLQDKCECEADNEV